MLAGGRGKLKVPGKASRQPSEPLHGLGQRQEVFWREERSLWYGA